MNKKIIRELLMTVDTLTNRMKWLESQDRIRHKQVGSMIAVYRTSYHHTLEIRDSGQPLRRLGFKASLHTPACNEQVVELNVRNTNISDTVARIHQNVSVHLTVLTTTFSSDLF